MVEQTPPEVTSVISAFQTAHEAKRLKLAQEEELRSDARSIYKGADNSIHRYGVSRLDSAREILIDTESRLPRYRQTPWVSARDAQVEFSLVRGRNIGVLIREKESEDEYMIFNITEHSVSGGEDSLGNYGGARATVSFIGEILLEEFVPVDSAHHPSKSDQGVPRALKWADLPEQYRPKKLTQQ